LRKVASCGAEFESIFLPAMGESMAPL